MTEQPTSAPEKKSWFARHKILSAVLALVVIMIIGGALGGGDGSSDTDPAASDSTSSSSDDKAPEESSEDAPAEKEEAPAEPEPETYDDGTYEIGKDIPAGTYRSSEETDMCYWATLKGFGGELEDVIQNGNSSPAIVTLEKSTTGFETNGCGYWVDVRETFPAAPETSFGDGAYIVGKHIKPGRYRADGGADMCYWARVKHFKGGGIDGIITNGNTAGMIEIKPGDAGFMTYGCGTWSQ